MSKLQLILAIIQAIIDALGKILPGGAASAVAAAGGNSQDSLVNGLRSAIQLYENEAGKPFDVTKLP